MNVAAQMLEARTDRRAVDHAALALAIDAMHDVVTATTACADACLSDPTDKADCVRSCADAADVAGTLARVLSRTGPTVEGSQALVGATAKVLSECSSVCAEHGDHDKHCRICAEVCSRGQQALAGLGAAIAAAQRTSTG
jgi:hypothetical protein